MPEWHRDGPPPPPRDPSHPQLQVFANILAVGGYLSRCQGLSRVPADSDPRALLTWYLQRGMDPRRVSRPQVDLCVRWLQEIRRYKASTARCAIRPNPGRQRGTRSASTSIRYALRPPVG